MKKGQDTNLNENIEELKFEMLIDDVFIYEYLVLRKLI